MGGIPIFMITLTKQYAPGQLSYQKRKVLVISARVHAGETNSSFVMESILNELI